MSFQALLGKFKEKNEFKEKVRNDIEEIIRRMFPPKGPNNAKEEGEASRGWGRADGRARAKATSDRWHSY